MADRSKSTARIGRDEGADGPLPRDGRRRPGRDAVGEDLVQHVTALRRYALLLIGEPTEADDLVQEALTRVLVHTRAWKPVRDLRAYLFTTLHNVFVDGHRRRRMLRDDIPVDSLAGRLATPPSQMDRLELRDLAKALGKLPTEQRQVVLLIGLEGMSYRDAARVLGVPIGTVMSRLSRGREALRHLTHRGAALKLRVVK